MLRVCSTFLALIIVACTQTLPLAPDKVSLPAAKYNDQRANVVPWHGCRTYERRSPIKERIRICRGFRFKGESWIWTR